MTIAEQILTRCNRLLERVSGRRLVRALDPDEVFFSRLHLLQECDVAHWSLRERFAAFVCERFPAGRAQFFQDLWVLFELRERRCGYFVDFGALDGVLRSNTWLLERAYGWTGIVAEPNPAQHEALRSSRTARMDPRCVYTESGATLDFLVTRNPDFCTLATYADVDHWGAEREAHHETVRVKTITLDDLLDDHQAPETIDYLSVDTEGSEYDILAAFSFQRHVRCITVEHNHTARRADIDALLKRRGYLLRFPYASSVDSWYIHRDDAYSAATIP
jgi:FkbM family methyltransferase